jgi:hypothetical protein
MSGALDTNLECEVPRTWSGGAMEVRAPSVLATTEVHAPGLEAQWRFAHLGY